MEKKNWNKPITVNSFVALHGGDDDEKIIFYNCDTNEQIIVPVGDLYIDDRYDDILNADMASWEYDEGFLCILYFLD